jgi:Phosphotransferase enzyme family
LTSAPTSAGYDKAPTVERVRELLATRLQAGSGGVQPACTVKGPVFMREKSSIFRAEVEGFAFPLAAKVCLESGTQRPDPKSARLQFTALTRVADRMKGDFTVPLPCLLIEEAGLVLMEWVSGNSLTDLLLSWRLSRANLERALQRAAEWLRRFHATHRLPAGRLNSREKLEDAMAMVNCLMTEDAVYKGAITALRRAEPIVAVDELDRSWIHGDFKTDNLILDHERTIGIDVCAVDENVVLYDIAPFLNQLELSLLHPSAWRLAFHRERLLQAFLGAYFGDRQKATHAALTWVRLCSILDLWTMIESRTQRRVGRYLLRGECRRIAYRLVCELDRAA